MATSLQVKLALIAPLLPLAVAVSVMGVLSTRVEHAATQAEKRLATLRVRGFRIAALREACERTAPQLLVAYYTRIFAERQELTAGDSSLVLTPAPAHPKDRPPLTPPPRAPVPAPELELVNDQFVREQPQVATASKVDADRLIRQLAEGQDFRVRVQAALQLGASASKRAKDALVRALADSNTSVRAAAATALERLGDPSAMSALEAHSGDPSDVVRSRVQSAITSLSAKAPLANQPLVVVSFGSIEAESEQFSARAGSRLRRDLDDQPGVRLAPDAPATNTVAISVQGKLTLAHTAPGSATVVLRLHDKNGALQASITGKASMVTEPSDESEWLMLIDSAIDSAARRLPTALRALASPAPAQSSAPLQ